MKKTNSEIYSEIIENEELFSAIRRSDIAHQFKGCIAKKGLKISDIAERLNVSSANVSRMLNGQQNLTLDKLHALADALQERLILALECNMEATDLLNIDVDVQLANRSPWKISNNYLNVNVSDYECVTSEAANDSAGPHSGWHHLQDIGYLEQQA